MKSEPEEFGGGRSPAFRGAWTSGMAMGWYLGQFQSLQIPGADPLAESRIGGPDRIIDPHPLFSSDWYRRRYPGAHSSRMTAVEHYLYQGRERNKLPHPAFEMRKRYGKRRKSIQPNSETPEAYLEAAKYAVDILFDEAYFTKRYSNRIDASSDAFREFVLLGAVRRIDPNPLFWTEFYCQQVPEKISTSIEAIAHYVLEGADLGYDPHPLFNSRYYQGQLKGPESENVNPLWHYLAAPRHERLRPNPTFDPGRYLELHGDVAASEVDALVHYITFGAAEGRRLD